MKKLEAKKVSIFSDPDSFERGEGNDMTSLWSLTKQRWISGPSMTLSEYFQFPESLFMQFACVVPINKTIAYLFGLKSAYPSKFTLSYNFEKYLWKKHQEFPFDDSNLDIASVSNCLVFTTKCYKR